MGVVRLLLLAYASALCGCGLEYVQAPAAEKLNAALFAGRIDRFWEDTNLVDIAKSKDGATYRKTVIRDRVVIREFLKFLNDHLGGWKEVPQSHLWSVHSSLTLYAPGVGSRRIRFEDDKLLTTNNAGAVISLDLSAIDAKRFGDLVSNNLPRE